ncbi:MAG: enoyl-CoA hydratase-related protein [Caenibius sp.]
MNASAPLRIEHGEAISWIVLDRPDAANAFNSALLDGFSDALHQLETEGAPVIGIRGKGKGFSAGADLSEYNAEATPGRRCGAFAPAIWTGGWRCGAIPSR